MAVRSRSSTAKGSFPFPSFQRSDARLVPPHIFLYIDENSGPKKTPPSVLFGPQQHVIQFADPFQFHFQAVVICKPALHLRFLLGPNTDLLVPPPGIVDG